MAARKIHVPQEAQIIELIRAGYTNKEVAAKAGTNTAIVKRLKSAHGLTKTKIKAAKANPTQKTRQQLNAVFK